MKVRAKRLGWNEELTVEQSFDLDEYDHDDDDLEGEMEIIQTPAKDGIPSMTLCLVGGQEADVTTVVPLPMTQE